MIGILKIKPCPFCRKEAKLDEVKNPEGKDYNSFSVLCIDRDCFLGENGVARTFEATAEDAINGWNTSIEKLTEESCVEATITAPDIIAKQKELVEFFGEFKPLTPLEAYDRIRTLEYEKSCLEDEIVELKGSLAKT